MIKELGYAILDTSQIINLIKQKKVSILADPRFHATYGLPFITIHQLTELGKHGNFEQFQSDLRALSLAGEFYTSSPIGNKIPIHIVHLFCWELSCLRDGPLSGKELSDLFKETVKPTFITQDSDEIQLLYGFSKKASQSSGIVSLLERK